MSANKRILVVANWKMQLSGYGFRLRLIGQTYGFSYRAGHGMNPLLRLGFSLNYRGNHGIK